MVDAGTVIAVLVKYAIFVVVVSLILWVIQWLLKKIVKGVIFLFSKRESGGEHPRHQPEKVSPPRVAKGDGKTGKRTYLWIAMGCAATLAVVTLWHYGGTEDDTQILPPPTKTCQMVTNAAETGDWRQVLDIVSREDVLDCTNDKAESLLMIATRRGDVLLLSVLLKKGAAINRQLPNGETLLGMASTEGHTEVIKLLLGVDTYGWGTVFDEIRQGQLWNAFNAAKRLLSNTANVNATNKEGSTALINACRCGHSEIVTLLADNGGEVNAQLPNGETCLTLAARQGRREIVSNLLGKSSPGFSAWMMRFRGRLPDPNYRLPNGDTALILACREGHASTAKLLIEHGAEIDCRTAVHRETPLMIATFQGHIEVVKVLLHFGADTSARNYAGETASAIAQAKGFLDIAELLLSRDVSQK